MSATMILVKHILEREQFVPAPIARVFAFFADAANLERLTPTQLRFKILTPPPIEMHAGTLIDYQLSLFGIPFRWRTLIESFEPERRFIDVQQKGPYRSWRHVHEFDEVAGGTRIRDHLEYEIPLGFLGEIAGMIFVTRQVEDIFEFRKKTIELLFPPTT